MIHRQAKANYGSSRNCAYGKEARGCLLTWQGGKSMFAHMAGRQEDVCYHIIVITPTSYINAVYNIEMALEYLCFSNVQFYGR